MNDNSGVRAIISPPRRPSWAQPGRWLRMTAFAALTAGIAWAIGREVSRRIESHDIETASRRQEPLPGIRKDPRAAINALIMGMGWVANLDGTAVAYDALADDLFDPDGNLRKDLSPQKVADILHLAVQAVAKKGSLHDIDPQAVLFHAQAGTLTQQSKAMARKMRIQQVAQGLTPDAAYRDWDVRHYAFTLDRLSHPSAEEAEILAAISRSKLLVMPQPGDTIRAVPVNRGDLGTDRIALWPGMLPPEEPMAPSGPHLKAP